MPSPSPNPGASARYAATIRGAPSTSATTSSTAARATRPVSASAPPRTPARSQAGCTCHSGGRPQERHIPVNAAVPASRPAPTIAAHGWAATSAERGSRALPSTATAACVPRPTPGRGHRPAGTCRRAGAGPSRRPARRPRTAPRSAAAGAPRAAGRRAPAGSGGRPATTGWLRRRRRRRTARPPRSGRRQPQRARAARSWPAPCPGRRRTGRAAARRRRSAPTRRCRLPRRQVSGTGRARSALTPSSVAAGGTRTAQARRRVADGEPDDRRSRRPAERHYRPARERTAAGATPGAPSGSAPAPSALVRHPRDGAGPGRPRRPPGTARARARRGSRTRPPRGLRGCRSRWPASRHAARPGAPPPGLDPRRQQAGKAPEP